MAVIDKDAANKASQDKSQDVKSTNSRQNPSSNQSQDTSIQDIAERAFNTSYDAIGNVIRTASKAGVERAIADYQRDIDSFERSFKKDFLQTLEVKSEPYQIGASALRLLAASGAEIPSVIDTDNLTGYDRQTLIDRYNYLFDRDQNCAEFTLLYEYLHPLQQEVEV